MTKHKLSIEEKFNKAMEEEFKEQFNETTVETWVHNEFETMKDNLIKTFLGIEYNWHGWEFKRDSIFVKNMQHLLSIAPSILEKFGIADVEFTPTDIKSLKKSYKDRYMDGLNDMIHDYAVDMAKEKFNQVLEKLDLEQLREDDYKE